MSLRWSSYVVPETPKGAQKRKVSKIWPITPKRYEIGCQLLLITNRKSHTGFRLVPISMTLNDVERRNSPYFAFFTEFGNFSLQADYVTVVEDRPILSVKYRLPVPVFHFWPKLMHPAARSLCDSWATCTPCFSQNSTSVPSNYKTYSYCWDGRALVYKSNSFREKIG